MIRQPATIDVGLSCDNIINRPGTQSNRLDLSHLGTHSQRALEASLKLPPSALYSCATLSQMSTELYTELYSYTEGDTSKAIEKLLGTCNEQIIELCMHYNNIPP